MAQRSKEKRATQPPKLAAGVALEGRRFTSGLLAWPGGGRRCFASSALGLAGCCSWPGLLGGCPLRLPGAASRLALQRRLSLGGGRAQPAV